MAILSSFILIISTLLVHSQIVWTAAVHTTPTQPHRRGDSAPGVPYDHVTSQPVNVGTTPGSSSDLSQPAASTPGPSYVADATTSAQAPVIVEQPSTQSPPTDVFNNNNGGVLPPGPDSLNTNNGPDNIPTTPKPIVVTPAPVVVTNPPIAPTNPPTPTVPVYPGSVNGNQGWVYTNGQTNGVQNKFGSLNLSPWLFYGRDFFPLLYLLMNNLQSNQQSSVKNIGLNNYVAPLYYSGVDLDKLLPYSYLMRNQGRYSQQQQQQVPHHRHRQQSPVNNLANLYWFTELY